MFGVLRDVITRQKWNTVRVEVHGLGYVFLLSEAEYDRLKSYTNTPEVNLSMQQNNIDICASDNQAMR